ncbi:RHS repeat-associated core domain protein [Pseudoflavonifractor capillosus ATCC 29799]|uniref:RHS repeat-associated core domain protein n=2 Tax=Pseudoflavonifractor capillosus TaxID=106588 RepID=A6NXK0_9FIRM|nr:RHS repeat-associated core domain protein [Pseudoflavonifractor capillosus ATCC 29799]
MKFTKRVRRISIILLFALILQISPIHFLSAFVQQAFALDVSNTSGDYLESEAETQNTIEVDIPPTLIDETEDEPASSDGTEDSSPGEDQVQESSDWTWSIDMDDPEPDENSTRYIAILKSSEFYSQLTAEDASFLCTYTGISEDQFEEMEDIGLNLSTSINYGDLEISLGCSLSDLIALNLTDEELRALSGQAALYLYVLRDDLLGTPLDSELRGYLLQGFTFEQVRNAYGVHEVLGIPMESLLTGETVYQQSDIHRFAEDLGVSPSAIAAYAGRNNLDGDDLEDRLDEIEAAASSLTTSGASSATPPSDITEGTETLAPQDVDAPYFYDAGDNEKTAMNSGALVYETTDLTLPGVNGLDLVIGRRYNSQEANLYSPAVTYSYRNHYKYYVEVVRTAYRKAPGYPPDRWSDYDSEEVHGLFDTHSEANLIYQRVNGKTIIFEDFDGEADLILECSATVRPFCVNSTAYPSSTREEDHYWTDLYGLGYGWSFLFSSIETVDDEKYLHLSSGSTYEVDFDADNTSHLVDYSLQDMHLEQESDSFSNGAETSQYTLYYKDGVREYFSSSGKLIGIQDRYDNTITLVHSTQNGFPHIVITDTLSRTVVISGQSTENGHDIIVSAPGNITLTYHVQEADTVQSLASYEDAGDRTTHYSYTLQSAGFSAVSKTVSESSNQYLNLTTITHPTMAQTVYAYEKTTRNLGASGLTEAYRAVSRKDVVGGTDYNVLTYSYSINDFTGYPEHTDPSSLPDTFTYSASVTDAQGVTTTATFNSKHLQVSALTAYGTSKLQEVTYEYNDDTLPTTVTTKYYSESNQTSPMTVTVLTEYDSRGNVTAEWSPLADGNKENSAYKTSYTYDSTYSLLLSKAYQTDASTEVELNYTLSSDKKSVVRAETYVNDVLQRKTEYTVDDYGNITSQKVFHDGFTDYDLTEYGYQSNAYLSYERHTGVLDADGNGASSTPGQSAGVIMMTYSYDDLGRMTQSSDGAGQITSYAYDALGNITSTTNPDGTTVQYVRDYAANAVTVTDENGAQVKYTYTPLGLEYETVDVTSGLVISRKTYDSMSQLAKLTDFVYGGVTEYTYDVMGRIASETAKQVDTVLAQTLYAYDDAAESGAYQKVTKTVVGGGSAPSIITTQYTDRMGNIVRTGKVSNGTEHQDTYTYNYVGDLLTERTAASAQKGLAYTARYEYNGLGQAVKVYNALGQYTTSTYNALGQLVQTTDYAGTPTTYTYDALGRLLAQTMTITDSVTATSKYYYNPCGSITTELTPNQAVGSAASWSKKEYSYDSRQRLVAVAQYDGGSVSSVTRYTYDGVGNTLSMATGLDAVDGTGGSVTSYTYDRFGNVLTMTDALGKTEQCTYSPLGRLTQKTDRADITLKYAYDALGRVISISGNGGANTIRYVYAKTGATLSESNITVWETDREPIIDKVKYREHTRTTKTAYSYDSLGNVITVSETDQETVVTKTDPLLQIPPDPTPDPELELYSITFPGGSGGGGDSGSGDSGSVQPDSTELVPVYAKNYAYDLAGNRVYFQLSINGNAVENINYNYDALNRLIQVVGSGALQAAYTYDVNGNRATLTNGNGITTNYEYNLANWVTSMSAGKRGETLFDYSYAYYASGTQKSKTDIAGKTTSYVYDGLGRLTQESESGGTTLTYVYDRNSNRVQMRATGAESYVVNYTYDEANRLLSETGGKNGSATVTSYTYDGNGSLLTQASTSPSGISTASYSYDAFGRQTRASINGTVALYSYNAQGLRTGKTVGEQNTSFLLDGDNIVAETRGGSLVSRYVYGVNLVSCRSGSSLLYYHQNAHGDVVKITTAAGAVNRSYDYDAFGNEKNPSSTDANPFRYCGEYWDSETGTYYLRARYYDPSIGRFTQQDTHWNTSSLQVVRY